MSMEDWGFDWYSPEDINPEENWEKGIHIDRDGNEHLIEEMSDNHILNTIKYFEEFDTNILKEEAIKRGLIIK